MPLLDVGYRPGSITIRLAEAVAPGAAVGMHHLLPDVDLPVSEVLALFRAERYTSHQIADFFGDVDCVSPSESAGD